MILLLTSFAIGRAPLNEVAVKIPVTTDPVFVVVNFKLLLKYNSTPAFGLALTISSVPFLMLKVPTPETLILSADCAFPPVFNTNP